MKKMILLAMAVAAVLAVGMMDVNATDNAGLTEYRVVSETPVQIGQVVDLFIPGLSGGKKFLSPNTNGIGLIRQWNPRLAGATWKTPLQQGEIIRLPQEWVLRGVQNVLEPAQVSLAISGESSLAGQHFWLMNIGMLFCAAGIFWIYLYSRSWHRRGDR